MLWQNKFTRGIAISGSGDFQIIEGWFPYGLQAVDARLLPSQANLWQNWNVLEVGNKGGMRKVRFIWKAKLCVVKNVKKYSIL